MRAKELRARKGVDFAEIEGAVPQSFIGDRHVGGCDDLYLLGAAAGTKPERMRLQAERRTWLRRGRSGPTRA